MVVFFILLSLGCYALGRHKEQQEGQAMAAQQLGTNPQSQTMIGVADGVMATGTPPPAPQYPAFPSPSPYHPNPIYLKQQNGMNVV
ncbi:hypothetical protein QQP08_019438 [Theobroma cacao]|nr:hypothetical protein QQP08_019438 [Theobroma cacao]